MVHGTPEDHAAPTTHAGEELVVVLRGRCVLHVDGMTRPLQAGDACHFSAAQQHHLADASADLTLSVVLSDQ